VSSGSGLARRLSAAVASGAATTLSSGATAVDIAAAARQGDALAQELFRTAGEGVGRGIAGAAALLDLELVIIGGSIALRAWDLLGPPLEAELHRSARLDFTRTVRVVRAELGDQAGLFGAARLAFELPTSI
jgi:glucokinase